MTKRPPHGSHMTIGAELLVSSAKLCMISGTLPAFSDRMLVMTGLPGFAAEMLTLVGTAVFGLI